MIKHYDSADVEIVIGGVPLHNCSGEFVSIKSTKPKPPPMSKEEAIEIFKDMKKQEEEMFKSNVKYIKGNFQKGKSLRFCMYGQYDSGVTGHPQGVMKALQIKYKTAIPHSIADQWWFIDCEFDCVLPEYIKEMEFTDKDRKHWGVE